MTHRGDQGKLLSPGAALWATLRGRQGLGVMLEQVSLCQEETQLCSFTERFLQAWPPILCSPWRFQAEWVPVCAVTSYMSPVAAPQSVMAHSLVCHLSSP